jgi:hypothetical protein
MRLYLLRLASCHYVKEWRLVRHVQSALLKDMLLVLEQQIEGFLLAVLLDESLLAFNDLDFEVLQHAEHEFDCLFTIGLLAVQHVVQEQLRVLVLNVALCFF